MLWHVEGLLRWDFTTLVSITDLEEEVPSIIVLIENMFEKYTTWKG
jgi:hypothetical protein